MPRERHSIDCYIVLQCRHDADAGEKDREEKDPGQPPQSPRMLLGLNFPLLGAHVSKWRRKCLV